MTSHKRTLLLLTTVATLLLSTTFQASAHPGRTDSKGGHTCQTNCAQWGLATGEYHLHSADGGYTNSQGQKYDKEGNLISSAPKPTAAPVATAATSPAPSKIIASPAAATPESTPTTSPSSQNSPTTSPTPRPAEESGAGILWTILILFATPVLIGIYLFRKYRK